MSEFKMSDLVAKGGSTQQLDKEVNYFWKKFDFTQGRTFTLVHSENPYCKQPEKSASKEFDQ